MMPRLLPAVVAVLLAGCAGTPSSPPSGTATFPLADSTSVIATYDLAAGIDEQWRFTVGEPAAGSGRLSFALVGPGGAPARMDALCFEYAYEQRTPTGSNADEGSRGTCGAGVFLSPELALEADAVFRLDGAAVLPGQYSFRATGGPQLASLVVELVAR